MRKIIYPVVRTLSAAELIVYARDDVANNLCAAREVNTLDEAIAVLVETGSVTFQQERFEEKGI